MPASNLATSERQTGLTPESKRRRKWVPVVIKTVIAALILGGLGSVVSWYGNTCRPDLKYHMSRIEPEPGTDVLPSALKGVMRVASSNANENVFKYVSAGVLKKDYIESRIDGEDRTVVEWGLWSWDDLVIHDSGRLLFDFPGHPQNMIYRCNQNTYRHKDLIHVTVCASYEDEVLIQVQSVDADFSVQHISKIQVPIPLEQRGSRTALGDVQAMGYINSEIGRQLYLAVGFNLNEQPASHWDWLNEEHGQDERDPNMKSPYGLLVVPAHQLQWQEPFRVLNIPGSIGGVWGWTISGWDALVFRASGHGHGRYTVPTPEQLSANPEYAGIFDDSDYWTKYYLLSTNSLQIHDKLRLGSIEGEDYWPQSCSQAYSFHNEGNYTSEMQIVHWPDDIEEYRGHIYVSWANSPSFSHDASFSPEFPLEIEHEPMPKHAYGFQIVDTRIGFIVINEDGSSSLLLQQESYTPVDLSWVRKPAPEQGTSFTHFIGVVHSSASEEAFALVTDTSHVVVIDTAGNTLAEAAMHDLLNMPPTTFAVKHPMRWQRSSIASNFIYCTSDVWTGLARFDRNDRYISGWSYIHAGSWVLLGMLWIGVLGTATKREQERAYVTSGDLDSAIAAEHEAKEVALDEAHDQHTTQSRARLGQIADSLAHNLNTPLSAVRVTLERLNKEGLLSTESQAAKLIDDESQLVSFLELLRHHYENPSTLTLAQINSLADDIEEELDSWPELANAADLFAKNGFLPDTAEDFASRYGHDRAPELISLLDEVASYRRGIASSLTQLNVSFGLVNRLKHLTKHNQFEIGLSLETSLEMLEASLASRKIQVQQRLTQVPKLPGDPLLMVEIISNILTNAIDALPVGGTIDIELKVQSNQVILVINNDGPAIPTEKLESIFERGYTTKATGTGLGLFIVKEGVEQLGGSIEAASDQGITTFTVTLPISTVGC